ncbi:MAG: DUF5334 family protein [Pseudomonadota bacterium]|nr:DUF5334 family protein [Pseudomonadota bacterium]
MKTLSILFLAFLVTPALAWDGQDTEQGTNIMISSRSTATPGNEIIYYDYSKEEYRTAEVTSVYGFGKLVQIELYDVDTGLNRTFEMEE